MEEPCEFAGSESTYDNHLTTGLMNAARADLFRVERISSKIAYVNGARKEEVRRGGGGGGGGDEGEEGEGGDVG